MVGIRVYSHPWAQHLAAEVTALLRTRLAALEAVTKDHRHAMGGAQEEQAEDGEDEEEEGELTFLDAGGMVLDTRRSVPTAAAAQHSAPMSLMQGGGTIEYQPAVGMAAALGEPREAAGGHQRRRNTCFNCGMEDHGVGDCPQPLDYQVRGIFKIMKRERKEKGNAEGEKREAREGGGY